MNRQSEARTLLLPLTFLLLFALAATLPAQTTDMKNFTFQSNAASGNGNEGDVTGLSLLGITITGSSGSNRVVAFEVADTVGTYTPMMCINILTLTQASTASAAGGVSPHRWQCSVAGFKKFRTRISAGTTGTIDVVGLGLSRTSSSLVGAVGSQSGGGGGGPVTFADILGGTNLSQDLVVGAGSVLRAQGGTINATTSQISTATQALDHTPVPCNAPNFVRGMTNTFELTCIQVSFSDLGGTISDAQVPNLNLFSTGLAPSQCVQTDNAGQLSTTGSLCGAGGGGGGSITHVGSCTGPQCFTLAAPSAAQWWTMSTSPATPPANTSILYIDNITRNFAAKNDTGGITHGIQTKVAVPNEFVTSVASTGAVGTARPSVANLSDAATLATKDGVQRLTNTQLNPREVPLSGTNVTPNLDQGNIFVMNTFAGNLNINCPTGTGGNPVPQHEIEFRFFSASTPRTLTWNSCYSAEYDLAIPTVTTGDGIHYDRIKFVYNTHSLQWGHVARLPIPGTGTTLSVREIDGTPSGDFHELIFSSGSMTDNGDGTATITTGAGGGGGDVFGPASSVDNRLALFSGTTGKILKQATDTGLAKLNSGALEIAIAGTDYLAPGSVVGVTDGDKGDIVVSGTGTVWSIDANAVALGTDTTGNYVLDVTAGAGLAKSSSAGEGQTVDLSVVSTEAGFLADGGATNLTCGAGQQGKMQVMDNGELQYCDGAATALLRSGNFTQSGLAWNVTPATCTADGNAGKLTVNASNQIICASDQGGAGGGGDISAVGSCATGDCFTSGTPGASLTFNNATSGTVTLQTVTGALGTRTLSLPAESGQLCSSGSVCSGYQGALGFSAENVGNKSSATALGTSDTLYPTQNAVKVFAETLVAAQGAAVESLSNKTIGLANNTLTGSLAQFNTAVTDANLLPDPGSNGVVARTGATTTSARTITGTGANIAITNGDAVAGNPTIDVGANIAKLDTANAWADGVKQVFNPNATTAGLNVGAHAGDPSALANGDMWYDSTANELTARINGVNIALGGGGGGSPGGSDTQVQYRVNSTTFGGSAAATYDADSQITQRDKCTTVSANTTLGTHLCVFVNTTTGNITISLPNAAITNSASDVYRVYKVSNDANQLILAPNAGDNINFAAANLNVTARGEGFKITEQDGAATGNWHVEPLVLPATLFAQTKTLTNTTFDTEATGNTFTSSSIIGLEAASCQGTTAQLQWDTPTANAPVATCDVGTNTLKGLADFADGANLSMQRTFIIPFDMVSTVDVRGKWKSTTGSTNNVVWQVATVCVADGETDDPAFNTASVAVDAGKATANQTNDFLITGLTITGCAAGELMHVRVQRDSGHASDNFAGTARLYGINLTMRRAQ